MRFAKISQGFRAVFDFGVMLEFLLEG